MNLATHEEATQRLIGSIEERVLQQVVALDYLEYGSFEQNTLVIDHDYGSFERITIVIGAVHHKYGSFEWDCGM